MKSELSFLIGLLLNQKLSPQVKKLLGERISEVEANLATIHVVPTFVPPPVPGTYVKPKRDPNAQSASTLKILQETGPLPVPIVPLQDVEAVPSVPSEPTTPPVIAKTPAAATALANRNALLSQATSTGAFTGKPEPGRNAPRKF
jgi:hypothetical protein